MNLRVWSRRELSPLERYAVDLVFRGAVDTREITLEVQNEYKVLNDGVSGAYMGGGRIVLSRIKHADAEDLHSFTKVDDIDPRRPNNIKYLSTLVHEVGHYWQSKQDKYTRRLPYYEFSDMVLRSTNFICKEQHASVGQVYFILKWQMDLGISRLDLTSGSAWGANNVGPAHRYCRIQAKDLKRGHRYMSKREVGRFFPDTFKNYFSDIRFASR